MEHIAYEKEDLTIKNEKELNEAKEQAGVSGDTMDEYKDRRERELNFAQEQGDNVLAEKIRKEKLDPETLKRCETYIKLGEDAENRKNIDEAITLYKLADKWGKEKLLDIIDKSITAAVNDFYNQGDRYMEFRRRAEVGDCQFEHGHFRSWLKRERGDIYEIIKKCRESLDNYHYEGENFDIYGRTNMNKLFY